jgi:hypothetical protein
VHEIVLKPTANEKNVTPFFFSDERERERERERETTQG